ncbi:MAG: hypothetical protein AAGJ35_15620, partial [Myxococcota bacterium]
MPTTDESRSLFHSCYMLFERIHVLQHTTRSNASPNPSHSKHAHASSSIEPLVQTLKQHWTTLAERLQQHIEHSTPPRQMHMHIHIQKNPLQLKTQWVRSKFKQPKQDAQLYVWLREEGLEIGFGFQGSSKQRQSHPEAQRFFRQLQRAHKKSGQWLQCLLQHHYKLWKSPGLPWHTPSYTIEEWMG